MNFQGEKRLNVQPKEKSGTLQTKEKRTNPGESVIV